MFFLISKLTEFLFVPSNVIGILAGAGMLALLLRRRRTGSTLLSVALLLLLVIGWTPVGLAALTVLENRFPQSTIAGNVTGIIMLGGAVDAHVTLDRGSPALNEAAERLTATATLSHRFPSARIFLSGGGSAINALGSVSESQVAKDVLVSMGVPEGRIEMEEVSRNTCENGSESMRAVAPKPDETWLLVTSASQMPRAVACFRAVGFPVVPYPVDFRTRGGPDLKQLPASMAIGLDAADLAAHEWLGLLTYRATGMTKEWFPAP
jgi:uncharacterized SAM-binding protein YcdF (DUF218 family)